MRDTVNNLRRENTQLRGNNLDLELGIEERRIYNLSLQDALGNMKQENNALEAKLARTEALLKANTRALWTMFLRVVVLLCLLFLASKVVAY